MMEEAKASMTHTHTHTHTHTFTQHAHTHIHTHTQYRNDRGGEGVNDTVERADALEEACDTEDAH